MKILLIPLVALGLLLGADASFGDDRDRYDDRRGFDRDYRNNGNSWGRREVQRRWDSRRDVRRYNDRDVKISLSFGNTVRSYYRPPTFGYNTFGFSTFNSFGSSWRAPHIYGNRQPVVIYQNNYIERSAPVIISSRPLANGSMLRDVQGRCYERRYDSYGNETRLELPSSACNF
jgi:hypothetical protein